MAELANCPFCGCNDIDPHGWMAGDGRYGPACMECGATAETPTAWNRRAPDPQAAARIEALEDILRRAVKDADWCKEHGDPLPPWNDDAVAALSGTTPPDGLVEAVRAAESMRVFHNGTTGRWRVSVRFGKSENAAKAFFNTVTAHRGDKTQES